MKSNNYSVVSIFLILCFAIIIAAIVRKDNPVIVSGNGVYDTGTYDGDSKFLKKKGNTYLAAGEMLLSENQPASGLDSGLSQSLGNVLGCADVHTNPSFTMHDTLFSNIAIYTSGEPRKSSSYYGYDVYLTFDSEYQTYLYNLLRNTDGQALLVNYETGEILASVAAGKHLSVSDCFDNANYNVTNNGTVNYTYETSNSIFQRRIYPGSTIKPIIAAALMEMGCTSELENYEFTCSPGKQILGNDEHILECYNGASHGSHIKLETALAWSCNKFLEAFVLDKDVDRTVFLDTLASWGLNGKAIIGELLQQNNQSCIQDAGDQSFYGLFIGQFDTKYSLVSLAQPYMAMANDGVLAVPHYMSHYSEIGVSDYLFEFEVDKIRFMSTETATTMSDLLQSTVDYGTAAIMKDFQKKLQLSAKTGTADNSDGTESSLCISFSNNENYPYLLAMELNSQYGPSTNFSKEIWNYVLTKEGVDNAQ